MTPRDAQLAAHAERPGYKTGAGRDRCQEALPPLREGYCNACGRELEEKHTRRGDARKFCGKACRQAYRSRAISLGPFLLELIMTERLYRHSDTGRANDARSQVARRVTDLMEDLDLERQDLTEADGVARLTHKDIRRLAREAVQ